MKVHWPVSRKLNSSCTSNIAEEDGEEETTEGDQGKAFLIPQDVSSIKSHDHAETNSCSQIVGICWMGGAGIFGKLDI